MFGPHDLVLSPRGLRFRGRVFPVSIGKGGLSGEKREGDGATPRGVHRIVGMLYRADRMAQPAPAALPIGPGDLWSDDGADPSYNQFVRAPHPYGHERLRRADRLYDLVLLTDWNWPVAQPGKGSAIFVHRWRKRGHPTEGCLALKPPDLLWIARRIVPGTGLYIP